MKKIIFLFLIFVSASAFDIERIPDCPAKIYIGLIMARDGLETPSPMIREYIIEKWGFAPFEDEADSMWVAKAIIDRTDSL